MCSQFTHSSVRSISWAKLVSCLSAPYSSFRLLSEIQGARCIRCDLFVYWCSAPYWLRRAHPIHAMTTCVGTATAFHRFISNRSSFTVTLNLAAHIESINRCRARLIAVNVMKASSDPFVWSCARRMLTAMWVVASDVTTVVPVIPPTMNSCVSVRLDTQVRWCYWQMRREACFHVCD